MLKITTVPNDILNQTVIPVKKIDAKIINLIAEMEKTLVVQDDPPGVGLAAPQVGENLALFIIKPTERAKTKVFINPKIIKSEILETGGLKLDGNTSKKKKQKPVKLEGCLSIPRIWGPVKRSDKILVEYQDLSGSIKKDWFHGLEAIIIQHEIDHLSGVLFTQRSVEQNLPIYEEKNDQLEKIDY